MVLKKYLMAILMMFVMGVMYLLDPVMGTKAFTITADSIKEMILIIPPIFILLGLLDVWVPREMMIKYLGEKSGLIGVILAFIMGSAAAGPLYGAFPIAAVLMKKGAKFSNVLIFLGAWSTTKIPMFTFELTSLGPRFAITRLVVDIVGIIIVSFTIAKLLGKNQIKHIEERVSEMAE